MDIGKHGREPAETHRRQHDKMRRCSTTTRRAQMKPPPKPHTETLRKARKDAPNPTSRAELGCGLTWRASSGIFSKPGAWRMASGRLLEKVSRFAPHRAAAPSCRSRHYDTERSSIACACRGRRAAELWLDARQCPGQRNPGDGCRAEEHQLHLAGRAQ